MSVAPSGTCHFAPQCSTWWIGAPHRNLGDVDIYGDDARLDVAEANWSMLLTRGGWRALSVAR
eukprot:4470853-Pyramimonas_sp.AAC.1